MTTKLYDATSQSWFDRSMYHFGLGTPKTGSKNRQPVPHGRPAIRWDVLTSNDENL